MDISLSPELQAFVQSELRTGSYRDASEVVSAGLRRLKRDQSPKLPEMPETREELEQLLLRSVESLDAGKGVDGEEVFARLRERSRQFRLNVAD